MSGRRPLNGYDFANTVITHCESHENVVETLLKYSKGSESDWFEFKAGMILRPETATNGETQADLYWNIAHELIAMMNSTGGVLIIGISDDPDHHVVPLRSNDPRHKLDEGGIENYLRTEIINRIEPTTNHKWTTKNQCTWTIDDEVPVSIIPKIITYQNEKIVALLVPPSPEELVFVTQASRTGSADRLPYRLPGDIGEARNHESRKAWEAYRKSRVIYREEFSQWTDEILRLTSPANGLSESKLLEKQQKYLSDLIRAREANINNYVDLTAAQCNMPAVSSESEVFMSCADPFSKDELEDESAFETAENPGNPIDSIAEIDNEAIVTIPNSEQSLLSLLNKEPRLALIGEPGQGKSTGLVKFAVAKMQQVRDQAYFCLYIELGKWHIGGSVESIINNQIGLEEFEYLRKKNRIHIILDALNECSDDLKPGAKCAITSFISNYPSLPVTISARKIEDVKDFKFQTYAICPLDATCQLQYLTTRFGDAVKAKNLLDRIYARSGGSSLASNPMLLRMVADVVEDNPQGELPAGRAKLYRKWTDRWSQREAKKANTAKNPLDFKNADDVRTFISQIAFRGRLANGQRATPSNLVEDLIAQRRNGAKNIVFQGPLLRLRHDASGKSALIEFLHETFQEYLCGEMLIANPDASSNIFNQDISTWEMPIAYALELNEGNTTPPSLLRIINSHSPWLGVAIQTLESSESRNNSSVRATKGSPDKETFSPANFFSKTLEKKASESDLLEALRSGWYSQGDTTLAYTLVVNKKLRTLWKLFEENIFHTLFSDSFVKYAGPKPSRNAFNRFFNSRHVLTFANLSTKSKVFSDYLVGDPELVCNALATDFISAEEIPPTMQRTIEGLKSKLSASQLLTFKESRLIGDTEFNSRVARLIPRASLADAALLIRQKLVSPTKFESKINVWDQHATTDVNDAHTMIRAGLITERELISVFKGLQTIPSPLWTRQVLELGLIAKESLLPMANSLARGEAPSADEIEFLKLTVPEKISGKLSGWLQALPMKHLSKLFANKTISYEDVVPIISEFIKTRGTPTTEEISALCLMAPEMVRELLPNWISGLEPTQLPSLLEDRVILPDNAVQIVQSIFGGNSPARHLTTTVRRLICCGAIPRDTQSIARSQTIDVVLDRMNSSLHPNTTLCVDAGSDSQLAVVIESTPKYAILKLERSRYTAICLPSTLQDQMMVLGDTWQITTQRSPKGLKVERAQIVKPSSWDGTNRCCDSVCGAETPLGVKMKAVGISHPVYWRPSLKKQISPYSAERWRLEFAPRFCRQKNCFLFAALKVQAI